VRLKPDYAVAHNNLGNALKALGRVDEAMASHCAAAALDPGFAEAHVNVGLGLHGQGQLADAIGSYRAALVLKPGLPEAHFGLAMCLQEQGRLQEAIDGYDRAIALRPGYAAALNNRGAALAACGLPGAAVDSYRQAVAHQPDHADAHHNLGLALMELRQPEQAIECYQRALQCRPRYFEAHSNLAVALQEVGRLDEARQCYARAHELGSVGALVRLALMLPPIMGTADEVRATRDGYAAGLDALLSRGLTLDDPLKQVGVTNFYLAYHGMDDRALQEKAAGFYERACPSLLHVAPHCGRPRRPGRVRVGFLSKYIYDHSVSRCFSRIVGELAALDQFDTFLISTTRLDSAGGERPYAAFTGTHVHLPTDLKRSRERVAALELDVLLYMDIGMDPQSYFLAFARLARVQCVMGGHPVTSGLRHIDHFLTTEVMEPAGADAHYTEALVRFPVGVSYFERPALPQRLKSRAELGLPEGVHLYMCPMKLQKMHPDFDPAMERILQLDPQGVVVLFEDDRHPQWAPQLAARLDRSIGAEVRQRIVFRPWIGAYADFISANAAVDVVLDPFHFGIGSTLVATFAVGTPIVTWPGHFLRGRGGMGFCRMMGLDECVVDDRESYAQRAVQFATDRALRERVKAKILANGGAFYENPEPLREFARWLAACPLD
jgi:protein O-GlcNAc transferase